MNTFQEIPASNLSISQRKLVYGIGVNDAPYLTYNTVEGKTIRCPFYKAWLGMFTRCYNSKYHKKKPTYKDCSVASEWLLFSSFKSWMELQDWEGKELDKDLLCYGNKIYSPDTCIFVTRQINALLGKSVKTKSKYLLGVSWDIYAKKFHAECKVNGKRQHLGYYISEESAHRVYMQFKKELIISIAYQQTDIKLQQALLKIAEEEYTIC